MPAKYLAMVEKFMADGMPKDKAQEKAARIFNAERPSGAAPVTSAYDRVHEASGRMKGKKK